MSSEGNSMPWPCVLPSKLKLLDIAARIQFDDNSIAEASTDFGGIIKGKPVGVFCPSSEHDIARLIRLANESSQPFRVTPRGRGHSDRGQSVGIGGVTIDMRSLACIDHSRRICVSPSSCLQAPYADVGAEQMWSEVMNETLKHGLSPRTWLDYLDLTVGGTLSVGGISGQVFRHGPQVNNVYELDVITGDGKMVTSSEHHNSDLFYATLGGLGQFGIITRARIALDPAPTRVRWVGLIYTDFKAFTMDEERLISLEETPGTKKKGFDYMEGFFFMDQTHIDNWRTPFFSREDVERISDLASKHGGVYLLELALNYDDDTASAVDQDIDFITKGLNFAPGFKFTQDLSYVQFLDRVRSEEKKLRMNGLWDVPHPWLNMLVPKSRIYDFCEGVFNGILRRQKTMGVILVYPLGKHKWDERMSLMFPDEDIFYKVGMLLSAKPNDLERVMYHNEEILRFCDQNKIGMKQYMPHYETIEDWKAHFGPKWERFVEMKKKYDPKAILAPGQKIFTSPLIE